MSLSVEAHRCEALRTLVDAPSTPGPILAFQHMPGPAVHHRGSLSVVETTDLLEVADRLTSVDQSGRSA